MTEEIPGRYQVCQPHKRQPKWNATSSFINHDLSMRLIHPTHLTRAGIAQLIQWPDHGLNSRWIVAGFQAWVERPDYLWSTPSLFFNRDASAFHWGWRSRGVKLTTHSHLVPRLRTSEATPPVTHKPSAHAHWQLHVYTTSKPTNLHSYVPPCQK